VDEYKAKVMVQRETIAAVLRMIHEKRDEVDARLERTQAKAPLLADSSLKSWSDGELGR